MELNIAANRFDYPGPCKAVGAPFECDLCDGYGCLDDEGDLICPQCHGCGEMKTISCPDGVEWEVTPDADG